MQRPRARPLTWRQAMDSVDRAEAALQLLFADKRLPRWAARQGNDILRAHLLPLLYLDRRRDAAEVEAIPKRRK